MHVSGVSTDTDFSELRRSHDLYVSFENYYDLFFPHGGSVRPNLLMTESEVTNCKIKR